MSFGEVWDAVSGVCEWTDRQTDEHTDTHPYTGDEVVMTVDNVQDGA